MSDLTFQTVSELSAGLAARKFSAMELLKAFQDRIEAGSELNAFISLTPDLAKEQALEADQRIRAGQSGPLLGIPIAVKDIISTKGYKTTCASKILENYVAPYDATVTSKLKEAGAVIVGKTNMDEFAMGSSNEHSIFGPVKNPWDTERVPGGSSGGSAAAVAARLAPLALGTDTGGSIRQPASLCSIVGLKPTYGRVSRYGVVAFASSLDQVGSFAVDVRDCARLTGVICGHDPMDSTSVSTPVPDFEKSLGQSIKGLRIGIPKEYFIPGLATEVEAAIKTAIKQFVDLGAVLVDISLPHTEAALACYYILAPAEASSNLARFDGVKYGYRAPGCSELSEMYSKSRSAGFGDEVKRRIMIGAYVLSSGYFDAYYLHASKVRTLIAKDFKDAFANKCDVILCPTSPTTAFKRGEKDEDPMAMYLNDVFTIPVNLAGLPGMSMPCGFDSKGLPIGLQLIGKPWDEETIFKAGFAYESASQWRNRRSKLTESLVKK
jgi:aspartyl-tRNA(Asn)/glutamyl-tRNA(Gln) amidotransferase subunit A